MEKYFKELDVVGRTYQFRVIAGLYALETATHEKFKALKNRLNHDFMVLNGLSISGVIFERGSITVGDFEMEGGEFIGEEDCCVDYGWFAISAAIDAVWDSILPEGYPRFVLPNESQRIFNGFEDI